MLSSHIRLLHNGWCSMSPNLDTPTTIFEEGNMKCFCCQVMISEYLRPFDETYILTIIEDFTPTDEIEIFEGIEPIEIKMIEPFSIFLVICVCRTPYNHRGISKKSPEHTSNQCRFSCSEVSKEENTISRRQIKWNLIEFFFSKNSIDVKI